MVRKHIHVPQSAVGAVLLVSFGMLAVIFTLVLNHASPPSKQLLVGAAGTGECFSNMKVTPSSTSAGGSVTCEFSVDDTLVRSNKVSCGIQKQDGTFVSGVSCNGNAVGTTGAKFTCNAPSSPGTYSVVGYNVDANPNPLYWTNCTKKEVRGSLVVAGTSATATPTTGSGATPTPTTGSSQSSYKVNSVAWVRNAGDAGVCWTGFADSSCNLLSHEGGGSQTDLTCSHSDGSRRTTTITNSTSAPINVYCVQYNCAQCTDSKSTTHASCNGVPQMNIRPFDLAPGESKTCTYMATGGGGTQTPTATPVPGNQPTPTTPPVGSCTNPMPDPSWISPSGTTTAGTQTITWEQVAGAKSYALRINDLSNGWKPSEPGGSGCSTLYPGDICIDDLSGASHSYTFVDGRNYSIWVHARNACDNWSTGYKVNLQAAGTSQGGQAPTATKTPSNGTNHGCTAQKNKGDYNCDGVVDMSDIKDWFVDYDAGNATLDDLEYWRRSFKR